MSYSRSKEQRMENKTKQKTPGNTILISFSKTNQDGIRSTRLDGQLVNKACPETCSLTCVGWRWGMGQKSRVFGLLGESCEAASGTTRTVK